eukprot:8064145-Alexandrium_andersonii.AAC.1
MSASLVGSEMCIRDRQNTAFCSVRLHTALGPIRWGPLGALLVMLPPPDPVSYTHLTLPTICSV